MMNLTRHGATQYLRQQLKSLRAINFSSFAPSYGNAAGAPQFDKMDAKVTPTCRIKIPAGFTIPEPKPLRVADGNYKGALTAVVCAGLRLGSGIFTVGWRPTTSTKGPWPGTLGILRDGSTVIGDCARPTQPVVLWDNEANPRCRIAREACTMLDLNVEMRPSSSNIDAANGPVLKDGVVVLRDTREIVNYLFETYGPGKRRVPWVLRDRGLSLWTASLASTLRNQAGSQILPNALPASTRDSLAPLTLWGFEGSPFVRPVREALSSLGLRYVLVSCGRGSLNRDKLFQKTGRFQVPYLEDRNTGVCMFESGEIVKYLLSAYTVPVPEPVPAPATSANNTVSASETTSGAATAV